MPDLKAGAGVRLTAADTGLEWGPVEAADGAKPRRFSMTGYTGTAMNVGFGAPVVVDLAGLKVPRQDLPILRQHDPERIVGHTDNVEVTAQRLKLGGVVSGAGEAAAEVLATAANGFPWQASIGASADRVEHVDAGETVKVNGRLFAGPVYVVRASTLREVSFVPIGADGATSATVASYRENPMNFEEYVAAKGFDPAALSDAGRQFLQAQFEVEGKPKAKADPSQDVQAGQRPAGSALDEIAAAAQRENDRRQKITELAAKYMGEQPHRSQEFHQIARLAIEGKWDTQRAELEFLKADYGRGPAVVVADREEPTAAAIEAAVCRRAKLRDVESKFDARTLELSEKKYKRGIGLKDLIHLCAQRGGWRGLSVTDDVSAALRACERPDVRAADGHTTYSLPGILSNVANKFIVDNFTAVEAAWRPMAAVRPVNDFKQISSYSLTGNVQYRKLAPGGQIEHGSLGEQTYNNQADTYAIGVGIDRRDIINDDAGAFQRVGQKLGRGAALAVNHVFWTTFLNNSSFFTSGRNNAFSGGTTVLAASSLETANANFKKQTDPDGKPLGVTPRLLVVPVDLEVTALRLMNSQQLFLAGTAGSVTERGDTNPFFGRYQVVSSVYASNTSYTGYSTTAWYLLADPMDLPVVEVCFLNGVETPTVESSDMEFSNLGIKFRGYHDFGVALQEYRGGVRMAGS